MEPRDMIAEIETQPRLPRGEAERYRGYAVMALPFRAGHILGLRRFPASSIGPAFTSVWHRDPKGSWTFYADVAPQIACSRYFGAGIDEARQCPIEIDWTGARSFTVRVGDGEIDWQLKLQSTPVSSLMSAVCANLPGTLWQRSPVLSMMGAVGGTMLRAGKINLHGRTCNGQHFEANPLHIWTIPESHAVIGGERISDVGPIPAQAQLGDFWLPQRGLFIIGEAFMEPLDPARHNPATSRADQTATV